MVTQMSDYNPNLPEMDWDDEIENDNAYEVLPEGDYRFQVQRFERARYPGGAKIPPCKKAVLTLSVSNGAHSGTVTTNLLLHKSLEWKLCQFFTSIGQRRHGERLHMNWNGVPAAAGICRIGVRKWTGNDGKEHEGNEIAEFYDPADAPNVPVGSGFTELSQGTKTPWDTGEF